MQDRPPTVCRLSSLRHTHNAFTYVSEVIYLSDRSKDEPNACFWGMLQNEFWGWFTCPQRSPRTHSSSTQPGSAWFQQQSDAESKPFSTCDWLTCDHPEKHSKKKISNNTTHRECDREQISLLLGPTVGEVTEPYTSCSSDFRLFNSLHDWLYHFPERINDDDDESRPFLSTGTIIASFWSS